MLKAANLHATVGDKPILKGLLLTVNAGEIYAIIEPNGAGKSTADCDDPVRERSV